MIVVASAHGCSVSDATNLRALSASVAAGLDATEAFRSAGDLDADGAHVWVNINWLRQSGASAIGDTDRTSWAEGFEAMIGYATSKGWVSADGVSVRAHIEA